MKTLTSSASALKPASYTIGATAKIQICSPYTTYLGLSRDAERDRAWETFGTPNLAAYFSSGMQKFQNQLTAFGNLHKSVSKEQERELSFMLDALIQARQLIAETSKEKKL